MPNCELLDGPTLSLGYAGSGTHVAALDTGRLIIGFSCGSSKTDIHVTPDEALALAATLVAASERAREMCAPVDPVALDIPAMEAA